MAGNLGRLNVEMSADTVKFNRAMDKASNKATKTFKKISSGIKSMAGVFAVALGPAALGLAIKRVIDDADELSKMSRKIGVSIEALSSWRHAAQLAGSEFAVLAKGVARLSRVASDASAGLLTAKRPLDQLNVAFQNTDGTLRNVEDILLDVADKFSKMADGTKKAALAQELFGRAGVELIPFLNEGRKGLAAIRIEAEKLGIVFTADAARGAEQFNDDLTRLQGKLRGVFITMSNDLLPVLLTYTDRMVTAAKETDDAEKSVATLGDTLLFIGTTAMAVNTLFRSLSVAIGDLAVISKLVTVGEGGAEVLFGPVINTVRYFDEIKAILAKSASDQEELWNKLNTSIVKDRVDSLNSIRETTRKATSETERNAVKLTEQNKLLTEGARLMQSLRTPTEKLADAHQRLDELVTAGAISQETYNRAAEKAIKNFDKQAEKAKEVESIMTQLGATFSSQFEDAIVQGKKFSEVLNAIGADILRIAVRRSITEPLFGAIFGTGGGDSLLGSIFSAKGNVFSNGSLSMFAKGGVINSPIAFPMAGGRSGVAGEAGVEAILPLMRTKDGDLGVKADQGGRTVVTIITPPGAQASEERQVEGGVERINIFIDDATAGNIRPGTKTYRALKESFGLGTKLINR